MVQMMQQKMLIPNVFQQDALKRLEETKENKGVVVMPTGTGKTFMAVLWFKRILDKNPNAKLLFICHNNDILSQANEKEFQRVLRDFEIDNGYYNSKEKSIRQVTFATTQTLTKNLDKFSKDFFDYIIVDECHHYQAKTFRKVLQYFTPQFMLGLTATPNRGDGLNILKILGKKIYEAKISDAIKKDLLVKINYYCVDNDIDFSNIKWKGNRYDEKDLNKKICIREYDNAILKEYEKTLRGRFNKGKTIGFCATVEHTHRMAELFNRNGIRAVALTGKYDKDDYRVTIHKPKREEIIQKFRNSEYDVIFVRDLFNEGVDIPDADSIMMLRPTASHTIFTQQIGRGLRKSEDKEDLLILDFTGNARKCDINFEVLGEMTEKDIIKTVRNTDSKNREELIIIDGNRIRLSKRKFDVLKGNSLSKEELIKEYLRVRKLLGRRPTIALFKENSIYSIKRYYNKFGSWNKFLKEIKESVNWSQGATKEDLIKEYNRIKKEIGRAPTMAEYTKLSKQGMKHCTIYRRFGKWTDFLKEVGDKSISKNFKYSHIQKDFIKEEYLRLIGKRYVSWYQFYEISGITKGLIRRVFGGWNNFLKDVGVESTLNPKKEDLIKEYNRTKKEIGRVPSYKDLKNKSRFCAGAYKNCCSKRGKLRYTDFLKEVGDYDSWKIRRSEMCCAKLNEINNGLPNTKKCKKKK